VQGYQTQLSSLQRQRRELQQALQSAHPGAAAYQRQRQQFKDSIIGLAASLAGLRSNMTYGAQAGTKAREAIHTNTKTLEVW
jgi:chromosome segregation ATPase